MGKTKNNVVTISNHAWMDNKVELQKDANNFVGGDDTSKKANKVKKTSATNFHKQGVKSTDCISHTKDTSTATEEVTKYLKEMMITAVLSLYKKSDAIYKAYHKPTEKRNKSKSCKIVITENRKGNEQQAAEYIMTQAGSKLGKLKTALERIENADTNEEKDQDLVLVEKIMKKVNGIATDLKGKDRTQVKFPLLEVVQALSVLEKAVKKDKTANKPKSKANKKSVTAMVNAKLAERKLHR
tara:strand:+ start:176 stop:898 length:723 start_codon:yes stop_codon:yes gene_type:complete